MAHQTELVVRFNELDPYNHVNHSVYVTYLEVGREDALRACDLPLPRLSAEGYQLVVTRLDVRYRAAAESGDRLTVETEVLEMRRASGVWRQRVLRGQDVLVTADVTIGVTDVTGRPTRPPEWLMAGLSSLSGAPDVDDVTAGLDQSLEARGQQDG